MDKKKVSLPISYSVDKVFESKDTRFLNVTIDVMHLGENLNESWFDKDVVEKELESIKNTPILGYVNSNATKDFEGHEYELEVDEDGEYKLVYSGHAYGVIPESCNPRWITKVASDGVSREYLQVDALMWTKFDDALDIMTRDKIKAQSMEITECEGDYQDDGLFHFSSFKFDGCCLLSTTDEYIQPAMTGANVTAMFSTNAEDVVSEIKRKLAEFQTFSATCEGKETAMEDNKNLEEVTVETPEVESEITSEAEENKELEIVTEETVEEFEAEDETKQSDVEAPEVTEEAPTEPETEEAKVNEEENGNKEVFSMTHRQLQEAVEHLLWAITVKDSEGYDMHKYWLYDMDDTDVYVIDNEDGKLYGMKYSIVSPDDVVIDMDSKVRKQIQYVDVVATEEEGQEFSLAMSKVEELRNENKEYHSIKPKYDNYVALEEQAMKEANELAKKEVIESYSLELGTVDEFAELIEKSNDLSLEEVKLACSNLFVNRNKVTDTVQEKSLKGNIIEDETTAKTSAIFERYGVNLIK